MKKYETARRTFPFVVLALCFVMSLTARGNTQNERALSGAGIGTGVGAVGSAVTRGSPVTGALTKKSQIDLGK